mgnify:CR=1 FL=1
MSFPVTNNPDSLGIECAGTIILTQDGKNVVMVENFRGNYSFCKGHIEKLKQLKRRETVVEAAFEETQEESGILPEQLWVAVNTTTDREQFYYLDEIRSSRKNPAINKCRVRYLISILKDNIDYLKMKLTFDPTDDKDSRWQTVEYVLSTDRLMDARKELLRQAVQVITFCSKMDGATFYDKFAPPTREKREIKQKKEPKVVNIITEPVVHNSLSYASILKKSITNNQEI